MIRRMLDVFFSLFLLLLLSPLVILLSVIIRLESPGPIIFKQKRIGKNEKHFYIYKFRSMHVNHLDPFQYDLIKHRNPLVTRLGRLMRRTKLDEIPQLWNVLCGNMSFIGPRPCLAKHTDHLTVAQRRRFHCLPGMTGWAEINGLDMDSWDERLLLDLWYVDNRSLWIDFIILIKTIIIIFFGAKKNEKALQQARLAMIRKGVLK